jgi:enterobacterial common antigen flippase
VLRQEIQLTSLATLLTPIQIEELPVQSSYRQIFKSTTLIGGSQVITILLGFIRTKSLAVLLSPSGVGLIGLYTSIIGTIGIFAGMGIGNSGVRQIAEAVGTGDEERIARTIISLRRVVIILGVAGAVILAVCACPISKLTFGSTFHAWDLVFLSIIIFFGAVSGGQAALIQGMRRVDHLAALSILGALFGTLFSVPFVFFFGQQGIVPFFIAASAASIGTSWWFARRIKVTQIIMPWKKIWREARCLLKLGVVFMATGVMTSGTMYVIQVIVARNIGLDAVGLFQAATTLSTLYIGVILGAMGADFYPRLTAVANDNIAVNRLVNEQAEVGLLLALPGIVFTLAFAPLILQILYSTKFLAANDVLRWYILGIFLRVICWPLGYIIIAKGKGVVFFWTETIANSLHIGLVWGGVLFFGLAGAGIAFFVMYILYTILIIFVARRLSGFTWSGNNGRRMFYALPLVGLMFLISHTLTESWSMLLGGLLTIITILFSLKSLHAIVGPMDIKNIFSKVRAKLKQT